MLHGNDKSDRCNLRVVAQILLLTAVLSVMVNTTAVRLRPEQAIFLDRIRGAGGVAFAARNCATCCENYQAMKGHYDNTPQSMGKAPRCTCPTIRPQGAGTPRPVASCTAPVRDVRGHDAAPRELGH